MTKYAKSQDSLRTSDDIEHYGPSLHVELTSDRLPAIIKTLERAL